MTKVWGIQEEAARLTARFQGINRAAFAREHKLKGGAAMIYQHIRGLRPISLEAAQVYAQAFHCKIEDISQRIAQQIQGAVDINRRVAAPIAEYAVDTITIPSLKLTSGADTLPEHAPILSLSLSLAWLQRHLPQANIRHLAFGYQADDTMSPTLLAGDVVLVDTAFSRLEPPHMYMIETPSEIIVRRAISGKDGKPGLSIDHSGTSVIEHISKQSDMSVRGRVIWIWSNKKP
jgi:hypothetical protein